MGGGQSVSDQSASLAAAFAGSIVADEFEKLKSLRSEDGGEALLFTKLSALYLSAQSEFDAPLQNCRVPSVIAFKYSRMDSVLQKEFGENVVGAVLRLQKKISSQSMPEKKADYSKSFGGTAEDTQKEKEAAELMRGKESVVECVEDDVFLIKPSIESTAERDLLRNIAPWKKFLASSGCFMFVHTLTKEIASLRPNDYEDEIEVEKSSEVEEVKKDPANGLPSTDFVNILSEIDRIVTEEKKTPLLLDASGNLRSFFEYKGRMEDVSGLSVPFGISGIKRSDVIENCRKSLVGAMKTGSTFALYLGPVTGEHADWKKKLCKKDSFPVEVFTNAGAKLLQPTNEPRYRLLFREADLEHGQAVVREGFRVVVISTLDPYSFEPQLEDTLPLGYMSPLYVRPVDNP